MVSTTRAWARFSVYRIWPSTSMRPSSDAGSSFVVAVARGDLPKFPHAHELRAHVCREFAEYSGGSSGIAASGRADAQTRAYGLSPVVFGVPLRKQQTLSRVRQPPVEPAAGQPGVRVWSPSARRPTDSSRASRSGRCAPSQVCRISRSRTRNTPELADTFRRLKAGGGVVPDEAEQMVAFF